MGGRDQPRRNDLEKGGILVGGRMLHLGTNKTAAPIQICFIFLSIFISSLFIFLFFLFQFLFPFLIFISTFISFLFSFPSHFFFLFQFLFSFLRVMDGTPTNSYFRYGKYILQLSYFPLLDLQNQATYCDFTMTREKVQIWFDFEGMSFSNAFSCSACQ